MHRLITLLVFIGEISVALSVLAAHGKVCDTKTIRSTDDFAELEGCQVIEGNLSVVLIDDLEHYEGSFPKLVEVTGVVLFFRVNGLNSLNQLFPNLAVIGGEELFSGYAFIVYEMFDLGDIGLSGLTLIRNGAVRIEKNPQLCYLDTVDWGRITKGVSPSENFLKNNKIVSECDTCPSNCDSTDGIQRCWSGTLCQKMLACPENCSTGVCDGDVCCHPNCVGGCSKFPTADVCTACKNVISQPSGGHGSCAQQCLPGFYKFRNRRCLTASECLNLEEYCNDKDRPCMKLVTLFEDENSTPVCSPGCPSGYKQDPEDHTRCVQCQGGICPKVCGGKVIDTITEAEDLKDCIIVNGSLHVKFSECIDEDKLEEYLGQIAEVTGYIAISNSYALHSLRFLKGLRRIGGKRLIKGKYAFHVFHNQNLQELIPEQSIGGIDISQGSVLFQYNEKLAYAKILNFVKMTNLNLQDAKDSSLTNGIIVSSSLELLQLNLVKTSPHMAFINWSALTSVYSQQLIGYTIFWRETSSNDTTIIADEDNCMYFGWNSDDLDCLYKDCSQHTIIYFIAHLKPWTKYAAYVRARTVMSKGVVSNVIHFTTAADTPSIPVNLKLKATGPGTLHFTWGPPSSPNGIVTNYKINWQLKEDKVWEYKQRNYCTTSITGGSSTHETDQCACSERSEQELLDEILAERKTNLDIDEILAERKTNLDMLFQDMLQNTVYIKRIHRNGNFTKTTEPDTYLARVYDEEELTVTNLKHYGKYLFKIQACHSDEESQVTMCSQDAVLHGRTLPNNESDIVDESTITIVKLSDGAELKWMDPPSPNSVILAYDIEIRGAGTGTVTKFCIPSKETGDNALIINNLSSGDYQYRIRATSLAGPGPWTNYMDFTYTEQKMYKCYQWTAEDLKVLGSSTPEKEKARCEGDLGYHFTQGDNANFPGCLTCWCCVPIG